MWLSEIYQNGMATLATMLLLLTIITFTSLTAVRIGVTEQQISANLYREQQAFAAAQAGLAMALENLEWQDMHTLPEDLSVNGGTGILNNNAAYTYSYRLTTTLSGSPVIELMATGHGGDGSGNRTLRQMASYVPPLIKKPDTPLTSRISAHLSGAAISNTTNNILIMAGSSITYTSSPSAQGCTPAAGCVVNPSIKHLSEQDYFISFFGMDKSVFSQLGDHYLCRRCDGTADDRTAAIIVMADEDNAPMDLENITLGSIDEPVILLIDGSLRTLSSVTLYGLLYVTGDTDARVDDVNIFGAIITQESITLQGTITLTYDVAALDNIDKLGRYTMIPGTWHDF